MTPPTDRSGDRPDDGRDQVLDRSVYESLIEGVESEEFLRDVIARFFEDGLKRLADLRTGVETADTRLTREVAHTLGGAAAMIGAGRLAAACRRFSGITRESLVQDGRLLLAQVVGEFSLARREADELIASRDGGRGMGGSSLPGG